MAYEGNTSIILGKHTMVFFNTESLCIAEVSFLGAGPSIGAKPRDGLKRLKKPKKTGEGQKDQAGSEKKFSEYERQIKRVQKEATRKVYGSGWDLYRNTIYKRPNPLIGTVPFSFNDLDYQTGVIAGGGIDIAPAGALNIYLISSNESFGETVVANEVGGGWGASLGSMYGVYRVGKIHDLYTETRGQFPEEGANARPFRNLFSSPKWIQELPPAGWMPSERSQEKVY